MRYRRMVVLVSMAGRQVDGLLLLAEVVGHVDVVMIVNQVVVGMFVGHLMHPMSCSGRFLPNERPFST
jgi:hypothetical protein